MCYCSFVYIFKVGSCPCPYLCINASCKCFVVSVCICCCLCLYFLPVCCYSSHYIKCCCPFMPVLSQHVCWCPCLYILPGQNKHLPRSGEICQSVKRGIRCWPDPDSGLVCFFHIIHVFFTNNVTWYLWTWIEFRK